MKKIGVCILSLLILMPLVVAFDINIKTLSDRRISVIVREAGKLTSLDSFHKDTGSGDVSFSSSIDKSEFDFIVTLKKDGVNILNRKFESIPIADSININFIPAGEIGVVDSFEAEVVEEEPEDEDSEEEPAEEESEDSEEEPAEEESEDSEEEPAEEASKENLGTTGMVVEGDKELNISKWIYYIIGGIVIGGVLIFLIFVVKKKKGSNDIFKVKKMNDFDFNKKEMKEDIRDDLKEDIEDRVRIIERKLREAMVEVERLKQ